MFIPPSLKRSLEDNSRSRTARSQLEPSHAAMALLKLMIVRSSLLSDMDDLGLEMLIITPGVAALKAFGVQLGLFVM